MPFFERAERCAAFAARPTSATIHVAFHTEARLASHHLGVGLGRLFK
jgi:hypothetical protein